MLTHLKRGWLLYAIVLGLVFQFFQLFRSQTAVLNPITESNQAAAAVEAPRLSVKERVMQNVQQQISQGSIQVDFHEALENSGRTPGEWTPPPPVQGEPPAVSFNFDAATFDYIQPAIATNYTLPPPKRTNQSTIVITLSGRDNFERRAAIRETWAKDNDNVYFIIGGPVPGNNADMDRENPLSTSSLLFREQQHFGDIIDAIHPDTYKSLPYKLHFAIRWVMRNLDNVHWIVKADDDVVVRVRLLQFFVLRKMNPFHPQVIGSIVVGGTPHRTGKWAEDPKFTDAVYPPWAFGSSGYVISRPVAQYVADHDHYYYQGEDAGLGIWLEQSPLQVTWVDTPELRKDEGCIDQLYVIGHDLNTEAIHSCFAKLGDNIPERPHIIAFSAGRKDKFPNRIRNPN